MTCRSHKKESANQRQTLQSVQRNTGKMYFYTFRMTPFGATTPMLKNTVPDVVHHKKKVKHDEPTTVRIRSNPTWIIGLIPQTSEPSQLLSLSDGAERSGLPSVLHLCVLNIRFTPFISSVCTRGPPVVLLQSEWGEGGAKHRRFLLTL